VEPRKFGQSGLGERIRREASARRRRSYWLTIAVLTVVAVILILMLGWRKKSPSPVLIKVSGVKPDFKIISIQEMPVGRQERLTVMALASSPLTNEALRRVIDWALFQVLDEYNRVRKRNVQVIWVYIYDQPDKRLSEWRAMAVFVDPRLPRHQVPAAAHIGGDAVQDGLVEYDFTNPVLRNDSGQR
jgi:hypothetical protein